MLALSRLADIPDDPAADRIERVVVLCGENHQRLVRAVGKAALCNKAQRDLIALIGASALDKAVKEIPLAYHSGHRDKDAVEQRRFIVGMRGVLLVKILHKLGHVELVGQADLTIRPVRHQVCHHALQTCHVSDPASVPSVAPSSLCLCHFCVSPI